jgi:nitroreductase
VGEPGVLQQVLQDAVVAATRAPSVHNTQPWRFRIGEDRIECFADFTRQLPVLDPTRRQLYLSCGAALHHLTVALRAAGYASEVRLAADDDKPDTQGEAGPVATVLVTQGPPATAADVALAAAINERHTQREPFADRKVEHRVLAALRQTAEAEGAWLAILDSREDQITLAVLLSHADQAELANPDYQRELHNWRRTEPATDGIPTSALPAEGGMRHSEVTVRDFAAGDTDPDGPPPRPAGTPRDERPALVILGTDADLPTQWIHAGQALSAVLLQATTQGLRASMLGQVIDLPTTRAQLRTELRLIGEPQMVLRIGYGPAASATPRRPLTEVLSR